MANRTPWHLAEVLLGAASPFIGLTLAIGLTGGGRFTTLERLALTAALSSAVTITVCYGLLRQRGLTWADLGLCPVPGKLLLKTLFLTPCVMVLMGLAGAAVSYLIEGELVNHQLQLFSDSPRELATALSVLLLIGLVVPFAEELLFRGLLFGALETRVSPVWTVGITAVIFGVYHGEPGPIAACTVMGIALGWMRHRTGSIWPAVTLHATNNLLVGVGMLWYWFTQ